MSQPSPVFQLGPRRGLAALFALLSLLLLGLGLIFPWVAKGVWAGIFLISLPCLLASVVTSSGAWGYLVARLSLGDGGLDLRLPAWRGLPWPPVRRWRLDLEQVRGLRRHTLWVRTFIMAGPVPMFPAMPLEVYTIATDQGDIKLIGKALPRLPEVVAWLAQRRGLAVEEGQPVRCGFWRALGQGEKAVG